MLQYTSEIAFAIPSLRSCSVSLYFIFWATILLYILSYHFTLCIQNYYLYIQNYYLSTHGILCRQWDRARILLKLNIAINLTIWFIGSNTGEIQIFDCCLLFASFLFFLHNTILPPVHSFTETSLIKIDLNQPRQLYHTSVSQYCVSHWLTVSRTVRHSEIQCTVTQCLAECLTGVSKPFKLLIVEQSASFYQYELICGIEKLICGGEKKIHSISFFSSNLSFTPILFSIEHGATADKKFYHNYFNHRILPYTSSKSCPIWGCSWSW